MYDPVIQGERLNFGISGLLYQSTVLFYDRQSKSLWSQMSASAVSGPRRGAALPKQPSTDTTWGAWKTQHPDTLVLSTDTGYRRRYGADPYSGRQGLMFPVSHRDARLGTDALVFGVEADGHAKAYPLDTLRRAPRRFRDTVGERELLFINDPPGVSLMAETADGVAVPAVRVKWFAWAAFHRHTAVYQPEK